MCSLELPGLPNELRIQRDLHTCQRLGHGTSGLGVFRVLFKSGFIDAGHLSFGLQGDLCDTEPFADLFKRDFGARLDLLGWMPRLAEHVRKRHRKAPGVRGGDQLFWSCARRIAAPSLPFVIQIELAALSFEMSF